MEEYKSQIIHLHKSHTLRPWHVALLAVPFIVFIMSVVVISISIKPQVAASTDEVSIDK